MNQSPALTVRQGTTVTYPLRFKMNGSPLNITGYTVVMAAKKRINMVDADAIFKITQAVHTNAVGGESSITLSAEDLASPGEYYYDIALKPASGDPSGIYHGRFTIIPAIVQEP